MTEEESAEFNFSVPKDFLTLSQQTTNGKSQQEQEQQRDDPVLCFTVLRAIMLRTTQPALPANPASSYNNDQRYRIVLDIQAIRTF